MADAICEEMSAVAGLLASQVKAGMNEHDVRESMCRSWVQFPDSQIPPSRFSFHPWPVSIGLIRSLETPGCLALPGLPGNLSSYPYLEAWKKLSNMGLALQKVPS